MSPEFKDILAELINEKVDYLLVGAFAVAAYGCARATGDIDIWVRASRENSARTFHALARFGAPIADVTPDYFDHPGPAFQVGLPPFRIDILTKISGLAFEEAWPNRQVMAIGGLDVAVIGRADLIINKKATGRKKDEIDVEMLEGRASS